MNPGCEPLAEFLGEVPKRLDVYQLEDCNLVEDYVIEWACNWKCAVDEFAEIYNIQGLHPQLMENFDHLGTPCDTYDGGKHSCQLIRVGSPGDAWTDEMPRRFGYADRRNVTERQREALAMAGIDPSNFEGDVFDVRAALIEGRRRWGEQVSLDFSNWEDDQLVDDFHYMIFPKHSISSTQGLAPPPPPFHRPGQVLLGLPAARAYPGRCAGAAATRDDLRQGERVGVLRGAGAGHGPGADRAAVLALAGSAASCGTARSGAFAPCTRRSTATSTGRTARVRARG